MEVGQKVWLEPWGNSARNNQEIKQGEVIKIGRKYYTVIVGKWQELVYEIQTNKHKNDGYNNGGYHIYFSQEQLELKKEKEELHEFMRKFFDYGYGLNIRNLSIEKLREIKQIIER